MPLLMDLSLISTIIPSILVTLLCWTRCSLIIFRPFLKRCIVLPYIGLNCLPIFIVKLDLPNNISNKGANNFLSKPLNILNIFFKPSSLLLRFLIFFSINLLSLATRPLNVIAAISCPARAILISSSVLKPLSLKISNNSFLIISILPISPLL